MSRFDLPNTPRMGLALLAMLHAGFFVVLAIIKVPPQTEVTPPQFIEVARLELRPEPSPELKPAPAAQTAQLPSPSPTVPEAKRVEKAAPKRVEKPKPKAKPALPKPKVTRELPSDARSLSSDPSEHLPPPNLADQKGADGGEPKDDSSGVGGSKRSSGQDGPYVEASYRSTSLHNPPTSYPPSALEKGLEGTVKLRVQVLLNGSAGDIQIQQSSGHALLDNSAVMQLRKWRFIPARRGNQPVESWVIVPINFKLRH